MNTTLIHTESLIYNQNNWKIKNIYNEAESQEYHACQYDLVNLNESNNKTCHVMYRQAKITPKKIGQFVTFWKRKNVDSPIEPFHTDDVFDFYVIDVKGGDVESGSVKSDDVERESRHGQFVFPKQILVKKGIVSTDTKEGKRGFRVYPKWDIPTSKQAIKTQQWQLNYFYDVNEFVDMDFVRKLYW